MKKIHLVSFIFIMVFAMSSCGQKKGLTSTSVLKPPVSAGSNGFYYFLPRTIIAVDVAVSKTMHQPGPFAQYAESLMGLQHVIRTPSSEYAIQEIAIHGYAEPDPEHMYFISPDLHNSAFYLSLSEAGLIQSINKVFDSEDFLKTQGESKELGHFGSETTFNYFIDFNLQEKIDTILERVRMDTITVERQTLRRSWVEKSSDVRAKEVADYILSIRDKKFDLITGYAEVNYSRDALEYMYSELNKQENDYLALFTGISSTSTIKYRYTFIPASQGPGMPATLFYFSRKEGIVPSNIPGSVAVNIEAKRTQEPSYLTPLVQRMQSDKNEDNGYFYRIPEHATVLITEGLTPRAETRMLINQYGVVTTLPPVHLELEFYPNTGSIKSVGKIE